MLAHRQYPQTPKLNLGRIYVLGFVYTLVGGKDILVANGFPWAVCVFKASAVALSKCISLTAVREAFIICVAGGSHRPFRTAHPVIAIEAIATISVRNALEALIGTEYRGVAHHVTRTI
jgi:hypothetical protein